MLIMMVFVVLFLVVLILMAVSRGFGRVAERIGQPGLVGELIARVALGALVIERPGLFPQLSHIGDNKVFVTITDFGIFFLMLSALRCSLIKHLNTRQVHSPSPVAACSCRSVSAWRSDGISCPRASYKPPNVFSSAPH